MKNKEERFSATISEMRQENTSVQERLVKEESEKLVIFQLVTSAVLFLLVSSYFDFFFANRMQLLVIERKTKLELH